MYATRQQILCKRLSSSVATHYFITLFSLSFSHFVSILIHVQTEGNENNKEKHKINITKRGGGFHFLLFSAFRSFYYVLFNRIKWSALNTVRSSFDFSYTACSSQVLTNSISFFFLINFSLLPRPELHSSGNFFRLSMAVLMWLMSVCQCI